MVASVSLLGSLFRGPCRPRYFEKRTAVRDDLDYIGYYSIKGVRGYAVFGVSSRTSAVSLCTSGAKHSIPSEIKEIQKHGRLLLRLQVRLLSFPFCIIPS